MNRRNITGGLFQGKPLEEKETSISAKIADYLDARGLYHVRVNSGVVKARGGGWLHLAPMGTPDRFLCYKGRFVTIEVKKIGETPTPKQLETHERIRRGGGIVIVAERIEDVINGFKELD